MAWAGSQTTDKDAASLPELDLLWNQKMSSWSKLCSVFARGSDSSSVLEAAGRYSQLVRYTAGRALQVACRKAKAS